MECAYTMAGLNMNIQVCLLIKLCWPLLISQYTVLPTIKDSLMFWWDFFLLFIQWGEGINENSCLKKAMNMEGGNSLS